ncbi:phosphate uptake regulator PhoU [Candidatus Woesearchaeota archaeon]|nr:phosphate uptake regulator PhoU [Candidatus Woesearchaeota archaeon]
MATRKIIQFGNSSYVVSLPKEWVVQNKLSKGDEISIDISTDLLTLSPTNNNIKETRIKKISCDNTKVKIGREIISAYINNYQIIEIFGQKVKGCIKEIEASTNSLVALEIMEQTPRKVIIKDFLNVNDISIKNIIKRMDIIIRAMLSEVQESLEKKSEVDLDSRDLDVNRLFYVGQKLIKKLLDNPSLTKTLEMSLKEGLFYWKVLDSLEKIADQQKRVIRNMTDLCKDCKAKKEVITLYDNVVKEYMAVVKALYKLDKQGADKVLSKKAEILKKCDGIIGIHPQKKCEGVKHTHNYTEISEKLKRFENYITHIAKAIINKD